MVTCQPCLTAGFQQGVPPTATSCQEETQLPVSAAQENQIPDMLLLLLLLHLLHLLLPLLLHLPSFLLLLLLQQCSKCLRGGPVAIGAVFV